MLTIEQLREMLELQEKLEVRIGGVDWREQGHDYALCVHMECAEIIEHWGWKHWKDTEKLPNKDAIAMEIVDVWHFLMAYMLLNEKIDVDALYKVIVEPIDTEQDYDMIHLCIGISFAMFAENKIPFGNFLAMMSMVDMDLDQLYKLYISKNVLNWFRQDNGYKEGAYNKVWLGKEDNEHLQEICEALGNDLTARALYDELRVRYTTAFL